MTTRSPAFARATALRIASGRSGSSQKSTPSFPPPFSAPSFISANIASNDSVRGSSAVRMTSSAICTAISGINLRFSISRKPAEPNTAITLPPVNSRAVIKACLIAFGVCAKSTMAKKSWPKSMRSILPGTVGKVSKAVWAADTGISRPKTVTPKAARPLWTLYLPIRGVLMTKSLPCP